MIGAKRCETETRCMLLSRSVPPLDYATSAIDRPLMFRADDPDPGHKSTQSAESLSQPQYVRSFLSMLWLAK